MNSKVKKNNGFTLIETLIYIGILGLVIGGSIYAAYEILRSGGSLNGNAVVQNEGNFVLRKLSTAFSGASDFSIINSDHLKIERYDGIQFDICLDDSNPLAKVIKARRGSIGVFVCSDASFYAITTPNVLVNNFSFSNLGTDPRGFNLSMNINGKIFELTKYLRK